ncbi:hypothetical protein GN156_03210 [bacterium LRH843]|nr:hypothetical protein [bacterium LRH843]
MSRQPYIIAFLWLLLCSAGIFSFTAIGHVTATKLLVHDPVYGEQTVIAGVDVSLMTEAEAEVLLQSKMDAWYSQADIQAALYEERVNIPADAVSFDIKSSLSNAWNEQSVDVQAVINEQLLHEAFKTSDYDVKERLNVSLFAEKLAEDVRSFRLLNKTYLLHEYVFPEYEIRKETVSEVKLTVSTSYLEDWAASLDGFVIEGESLFSLQSALKESGATVLDSEALDVLATGMFQLFGQTNFELLERHTNLTLPAYATVGYAAAASPKSMDLKVMNPNHHSYQLFASYRANELRLTLEGLPFLHDYSLNIENITKIEPRTIVQYSARRVIGDKQVMSDGEPGYAADVYLLITSETGKVIRTEKLASDYYPAVHRIEEWSLQKVEEEELSDTDDLTERPVDEEEDEKAAEENIESTAPTNSNQETPNEHEHSTNPKKLIKGEE